MDPHCSNPAHTEDQDSLVLDILCSTIESSYCNIPLSGGSKTSKSRSVPGWTDEVEPFKKDAKFWHSVWDSAGKPNTGHLYWIMTRTRNQFHYAVKRVRRKADLIKAKKLFESSLKGDRDLLAEMKKIRRGTKAAGELPDCVEGASGEEEIVDKFKEVYSNLYNSAGTEDEMNELRTRLSQFINRDSVCEVTKLTGGKVKEAVHLMKSGKGDVSGSFSSDAILHAPDSLFTLLAAVYTS